MSWINQLIEDDQLWKFYKSREWSGRSGYAGLKEEVLREQHYECQPCKERGVITRADTVHHVMHVREHPELALSRWYVDARGSEASATFLQSAERVIMNYIQRSRQRGQQVLPRKKNTSTKSDGNTPGSPLPYFKKGNEQREGLLTE